MIGQIAKLDQHGGNIGRHQHRQRRRAVRAARQQVGDLSQVLQRIGGELRRFVAGIALRQVNQDGRHRIVVARQVHAGDDVGLVFAPRQCAGLAVGAAVIQGIDRRAGGFGIGIGIGMQGDEQVGLVGAADGDTLAQGNGSVVLAGHEHGIAAAAQLARQLQAFGQRQVFFHQAVDADGARIQAAMAGIQHNDLLALAPRRRHLLGGDQRRQLFRIAFTFLQVGGPPRLRVELGPCGGEQVDHDAIAETGRRRQHQRVGYRHRRVQIDHHARVAGTELAVAIGLHRAHAAGPGRRAQPPADFGHVDHHPIGTGQREGAQIHRIGQLDHQPGAVFMLADAGAHHDRQRTLGLGANGGTRHALRDRLGRRRRQVLGRPIFGRRALIVHQPADGIVGGTGPKRHQRQDGGGNATGGQGALHLRAPNRVRRQ